jgi:hypothetical protein
MTSSGDKRIACRILGEIYAGRRPLGGIGHKLENKIEINFVLYLNK